MAEFLVFIRNASAISGHWMDAPGVYEALHLKIDNDKNLTPAQKIKNKEVLTDKYNARYQSGDILEVHENGYFCEPEEKTGHGWDHSCFALVKCPAMNLNTAKNFSDPFMTGERIIRRRRFTLVSLGLKTGEIQKIDIPGQLILVMVDKNG